jgi:hypothetical protein
LRRPRFEGGYALFDVVEAAEGFSAVGLDVGVEDFQLGGDVFDGCGKADDGIAGFIAAARKAHGTHSCYGYGGASDGRD